MGVIDIKTDIADAVLQIRINNTQPIDLIDYSNSMLNFGNEYSDFISRSDNHLAPEDIKLYVREIKTGSIITDLVAIAPGLMAFAEHTNTVIDFTKHIKGLTSYLLGKTNLRPSGLSKPSLNRLIKIVEPVAIDGGSTLQIDASNNTGNIEINISSSEANTIQNRANKELEKMREPVNGLHIKVLLYWAQARHDNKKGDKGIVESISRREIKVVFANKDLKKEMIRNQPHIFNVAYLVDIDVQTINDRPAVYKVVKFHEVVDLPED